MSHDVDTDEYGTLERLPDGMSVVRYRRRLAHPQQ